MQHSCDVKHFVMLQLIHLNLHRLQTYGHSSNATNENKTYSFGKQNAVNPFGAKLKIVDRDYFQIKYFNTFNLTDD